MTILNESPDMWAMLLMLLLLGVAVLGAMSATNRAERFKDETEDLRQRLEAQEDITRQRDRQLADAELNYAAASDSLNEALGTVKKFKEENGNLKLQVMAVCKDLESIRIFNSDMHRVIDMDAAKLKEKDRIIAEQKDRIDRLMKIRRR